LNAALQWQQAFCPQAEWIMKTDDDMVVHLPRLSYWIERKFTAELLNNPATYFGYLIAGVQPVRDPQNKW
jgi:beta-1,3-galactosyltransferase 1